MDNLEINEISEETKELLREKQAEITRMIEALDGLEKNKDWKTLKTVLFAPAVEAIERQLKNEALAQELDTKKIYRLQGEWSWAKQYTDIPTFIRTLKQQLEGIKNKLR